MVTHLMDEWVAPCKGKLNLHRCGEQGYLSRERKANNLFRRQIYHS